MTVFRLRYKEHGAHTHVRVFAGEVKHLSFGKCGELVFRNEEWSDLKYLLEVFMPLGRMEILPEED
jgi:hypothetical protein